MLGGLVEVLRGEGEVDLEKHGEWVGHFVGGVRHPCTLYRVHKTKHFLIANIYSREGTVNSNNQMEFRLFSNNQTEIPFNNQN